MIVYLITDVGSGWSGMSASTCKGEGEGGGGGTTMEEETAQNGLLDC